MRKKPLKNHTENVVEKLVLGPFIKHQNWAYLLYVQLEVSQNILKLVLTTCFYLMHSFLRKLKRSGTVSLPHFLHDFWRKIFFMLYFTNWLNLIPFTAWNIVQHVYYTYLLLCLWCHKFWNYNLSLLIKLFSTELKSQDKNVNIS